MPPGKPFETILQVIMTAGHYTIGDFLMDLFSVPGRSASHGRMLGSFLRGETVYSLGDVLERLDAVVRGRPKNSQEHSYTLDTPYKLLKSGHAALTSYTAQKVRDQLLVEQHAAVDPESGLHVFTRRKKAEPVKLRLSWDTYGATTFEDVQAILEKHQPLTFNLIQQLAIPGRHDPEKGYRYRPPDFVCRKQTLHVLSLTHCRLQHRCSHRSTIHIIEMQRGYKSSMESYSYRMEQHRPSLIMQADCVLHPVTAMYSTSSRR